LVGIFNVWLKLGRRRRREGIEGREGMGSRGDVAGDMGWCVNT
jgi:hypothetical protein